MASVRWALDNGVINNAPGAQLCGVSAWIRASLRRTERKAATRLAAALGADLASIQAVPLLSGADLLITNAIGGVLTVEGRTMAALGSDDFRFF